MLNSPFCRINVIIVNPATGRDARAVTASMAEQFWKEGQQRVSPESAAQSTADADVSYVPSSLEAIKFLTRALLNYR